MGYKLLPQSKTQVSDHKSSDRRRTRQISADVLPPEFVQEAIFAADSFWELEAAFGRGDGVVRTEAGYYGGTLIKPTYKEVSGGSTGHTEAVKVAYDKRKISYKSLCGIFWESHDPTNKNYLKFGLDTHRRSAIFYGNDEQKKQAQESKIRRQMNLNRRIVTKILPCTGLDFYLAENHHQKYHLQRHYIHLCECLSLRSTEQFVDSNVACKLNGILGGDEKNAFENLKRFIESYKFPVHVKLALEGIQQELWCKRLTE